jgi:hypothetical protein
MINRLETGNVPQGDFPFEDFGVPGKGGPGPKQAYSSGTVKASKVKPHIGIKVRLSVHLPCQYSGYVRCMNVHRYLCYDSFFLQRYLMFWWYAYTVDYFELAF